MATYHCKWRPQLLEQGSVLIQHASDQSAQPRMPMKHMGQLLPDERILGCCRSAESKLNPEENSNSCVQNMSALLQILSVLRPPMPVLRQTMSVLRQIISVYVFGNGLAAVGQYSSTVHPKSVDEHKMPQCQAYGPGLSHCIAPSPVK